MTRTIKTLAALTLGALALTGCSAAERASQNVSTASDNFEVQRRVVFVNGITDEYLLEIQGRCSITADVEADQLEVICKTGDDQFKKHYLGLSDNVTYFVEQLEVTQASDYHYRVIFRPAAIVPTVEVG